MNEPNFFIIGAAKCGTTALFDYLSQHPNTWCPFDKEPAYFAADYPQLQGIKSYPDYLKLFADADDMNLVLGEASVIYLFSREAVPEIRRRYPDAKLIIMIRNPVDMVYSFHSQMMTTANEDEPDFEKAWRLQDERLQGRAIWSRCVVPEFLQYGKMGRLSRFIEPVLRIFPRAQIKIIVFDDMKENPQGVFNDVVEYLGLQPFDGVDFRVVNANRTHKSRLITGITTRLPKPGVRRLSARLKQVLGLEHVAFRKLLARLNSREAPRKKLSAEFRRELVDYFADEVNELERITERDLSHWRR